MGFLINLLLFVGALSILIFIHELGHFIFAKIFKVYCHEFSIGMGPALFKKKFKWDKETTYAVRMLPIGGYVSMAGETVEKGEDSKVPKERNINYVKAWKRALIIIAGITFNVIFAFILILSLAWSGFFPKDINAEYEPYVLVEENSIAYDAGLMNGDKILGLDINGFKSDVCSSTCQIETASDLINVLDESKPISEGDSQTLIFEVLRDESTILVDVERGFDIEEDQTEIIGIGIDTSQIEAYYPGFFQGFAFAGEVFVDFIGRMFAAIGQLFTGSGFDSVGGPVRIFQVSSEVATLGASYYIWFIAIISINLAFFNLLPIPGLDGSRFFVSIFETISGKKVNPKVEGYINAGGLIFLLGLMVLITIKDIIGLF